MRQRGFILPAVPIWGWAAIAAGVVILGLSVALKVQSSRLESEQTAHAKTKGEYAAFVANVDRLGKEAKAKADAEIARNAKVNRERESSYEKRLAAINDAYRRLRSEHASSGSRGVPAIPEASIRAADPASDNRLLEALRAADEQTARLVELQQWVNEQVKP